MKSMKRIQIEKRILTLLANLLLALAPNLAAQTAMELRSDPSRSQYLQWWREARFGMFVHWGLYALPAGEWHGLEGQKDLGGEWIMYHARIPVREYEALAKQFNPVKFNADEWARTARRAGMKYLVFTAKGNTLYLHVLRWPGNRSLLVSGLKTSVQRARLLAAPGTVLKAEKLGERDWLIGLSDGPPDHRNTVVVLDLGNQPDVDPAIALDASPGVANRLSCATATIHGPSPTLVNLTLQNPVYDHVKDWTNAHDSLSWTVRAPRATDYEVFAVYAAADSSAGNIFRFRIGDRELAGTVVGTGSVKTFKSFRLGLLRVDDVRPQTARLSADSVKPSSTLMLFHTLWLKPVSPKTAEPAVLLPDGQPFAFWDDQTVYRRTYHVDQNHPEASDENPASEARPFRTLGRAARALQPGEKVVVKRGVYRETVRPALGGQSADSMVAYEAAPGHEVIVTGSDVLLEPWSESRTPSTPDPPFSRKLWMTRVPASFFGETNPFRLQNAGEHEMKVMPWAKNWTGRVPYTLARGLVFQDGRRLTQLCAYEDLAKLPGSFWVDTVAKSDGRLTLHMHPFDRRNPNDAWMEITTRQTLFNPGIEGVHYVRVRGFTFLPDAPRLPLSQHDLLGTARATERVPPGPFQPIPAEPLHLGRYFNNQH